MQCNKCDEMMINDNRATLANYGNNIINRIAQNIRLIVKCIFFLSIADFLSQNLSY